MGSNDEDCKHPMLDKECEYRDGQAAQLEQALRQAAEPWWRANVLSLGILLLILGSYVAILETIHITVGLSRETRSRSSNNQLSLIPPGTLEYEERKEWTAFVHPWTIPPSPELDNLWETLLFVENLRVTRDELEWLGENLTDLVQVDGGDYAAITGVIHHLHCLNSIRKVVHWDYYGPLLAPDNTIPKTLTKGHADHCIDAIRQALMCHANTALYTAEWLNDKQHPINMELKTAKHATCLKWETLDSWARQRVLVPGQYHFLSGPYPANMVAE
ncbi:hypothetical protein VM1G_04712 [Cytospora mali]|uniref:Cyclochlorotine biosynthesis protein O n=1 Tax=Cytospora mali TaxID=578113 RepID=A0A194VZ32_CYTMA|nr:hypothetical protein VM1G_04712 [Valsa mali]